MDGAGQQQQEAEGLVAVVTRSHEGGPDVLISTKIYAAGICCPSEVPLVHRVLQRLPGVQHVDVAVVTKAVTVYHAPALTCPSALVAALNEAQLDASLTFPRQQHQASHSWVPPAPTLLSLALLLLSFLHYLSGPTGLAWLAAFKWAALGAVAVGCPPIALKAWGAIRSGVLDVHMLMLIAVVGAIALGEYGEAATVVVLFSLADWLERRCSAQARDAISVVLSMRPDTAVLAASGQEVPADEVGVGVTILVRPGSKVALDGLVERGSSSLDESMLTGEAAPVPKGPGSKVSAGTVNVGGGVLQVVTTAAAGDSAVARMAALVEKATSEQSPTETLVSRFAKWYTPAVVAVCTCLALVPWLSGADNMRWWVYLALQLLVTACPCALVLSTPVAVVSAVARAAQLGALVKGGSHLEALAKVCTVTFDKTGTLTAGTFRLTHVELGPAAVPAAGVGSAKSATVQVALDETELLRLVGSLERGASHPIAAAIVGRAAAQGIGCDATVEGSEQVPGCGIVGTVDGHPVVVGTAELLAARGVADPTGRMAQAAAQWACKGATLCFVGVDGCYAGLFAAQDTPRPEATEALEQLQSLGVATAMLTGDGAGVAQAVAAATGLPPERVHASLLPHDKLELVAAYQRLSKDGRHSCVVHVGDGVNDAPALAAADVGIAMGVAGSAAAVEAGDVALFSNDLRLLPVLVELSRRSRTKILENIAVAVVSKAAVLVLASCGVFTLWGAVLVDVGSALAVTLNGVALLCWQPKGPLSGHLSSSSSCKHQHGSGGGVCCAASHKHGHGHKHGGGCCGHTQKQQCVGQSCGHSCGHGCATKSRSDSIGGECCTVDADTEEGPLLAAGKPRSHTPSGTHCCPSPSHGHVHHHCGQWCTGSGATSGSGSLAGSSSPTIKAAPFGRLRRPVLNIEAVCTAAAQQASGHHTHAVHSGACCGGAAHGQHSRSVLPYCIPLRPQGQPSLQQAGGACSSSAVAGMVCSSVTAVLEASYSQCNMARAAACCDGQGSHCGAGCCSSPGLGENSAQHYCSGHAAHGPGGGCSNDK